MTNSSDNISTPIPDNGTYFGETNPKDLDELQKSIRYRVTEEHKKYYPSKHNKDWVADDFWVESIARKLGSHINESYRPISDIKKAVGEMFPLDEVQVSFPEHFRLEALNQLRQEILTALGIEEGE